MADKKLNQLTVASAWSATCSLVGNDSASPTGSFTFAKSLFDLAYAALDANHSVLAAPTPGSGIASSSEWLIKNSSGAGILSCSGAGGLGELALASNNAIEVALDAALHGVQIRSDGAFAFCQNNSPSAFGPDAALARHAAGVVEVNNGTIGVGGGLSLPETASDADPAAPSSGGILYCKVTGGKNALFVRFPTGSSVQIAIEP